MLKCGDWGIGGIKFVKFKNKPRGVRRMCAVRYLTEGIVKRTFGLDV
jgi:hypothetical protein